ncbi:MAG: hypothetical protein AAF481_08420 [Acidobacteriota bacterium]
MSTPPAAAEEEGVFTQRVEVKRDAALRAVREAAETWGADWQQEGSGGRLSLPVLAGIRVGVARGFLRADPTGDHTDLRLDLEETTWRVQTAAAGILVFAGVGGLSTVLWPFFPALLPLAPLGAILALSGWFLVITRLQTSTPEDFLALVDQVLAEDAPDGEEADGGNFAPPPSVV